MPSLNLATLKKRLPKLLRIGLYIVLALGIVGLLQTKRFNALKIYSTTECEGRKTQSSEDYNSFSGIYRLQLYHCGSSVDPTYWTNIKEKDFIPNEVKDLVHFIKKDLASGSSFDPYLRSIGNFSCKGWIKDSFNYELKIKKR